MKFADARKLRERHAEEILTIGRAEFLIAERCGDVRTADHKVLVEEQASRLYHKYAVVVQDLAMRWIRIRREVLEHSFVLKKTPIL